MIHINTVTAQGGLTGILQRSQAHGGHYFVDQYQSSDIGWEDCIWNDVHTVMYQLGWDCTSIKHNH